MMEHLKTRYQLYSHLQRILREEVAQLLMLTDCHLKRGTSKQVAKTRKFWKEHDMGKKSN